MPSKNDLFVDYLKTIDDIQELVANNAELDFEPIIQAGEKPNEIIVPTCVMDGSADYSKPVCGTIKLTAETIRFKHDVSPQMIEKGFTYFKEFVNAFRREIEKER